MNTRFANKIVVAVSVLMAVTGLAVGYQGDLISSVAAAFLMLGGFLIFLMKHRLDDIRLQANELGRALHAAERRAANVAEELTVVSDQAA